MKFILSTLIVLCCCSLQACGKYGRPLPPEAFSPQSVQQLQVFAELGGVRFRWESPQDDLRGEELESLDGYRVLRKTIEKDADIVDRSVEFELLETIEDTSVTLREKEREQARLERKPARKIKANPELQKFEYFDTTPEPGKEYLYKIVPLNQDGVKGQVSQQVRVQFRGVSSVVVIVDSANVGDLLGDSPVLSSSQAS